MSVENSSLKSSSLTVEYAVDIGRGQRGDNTCLRCGQRRQAPDFVQDDVRRPRTRSALSGRAEITRRVWIRWQGITWVTYQPHAHLVLALRAQLVPIAPLEHKTPTVDDERICASCSLNASFDVQRVPLPTLTTPTLASLHSAS